MIHYQLMTAGIYGIICLCVDDDDDDEKKDEFFDSHKVWDVIYHVYFYSHLLRRHRTELIKKSFLSIYKYIYVTESKMCVYIKMCVTVVRSILSSTSKNNIHIIWVGEWDIYFYFFYVWITHFLVKRKLHSFIIMKILTQRN